MDKIQNKEIGIVLFPVIITTSIRILNLNILFLNITSSFIVVNYILTSCFYRILLILFLLDSVYLNQITVVSLSDNFHLSFS
jgi:hypothetical protein